MRRLFMENWLADRDYDAYRLISEPTYARRAALAEWLRDQGIDPDTVVVFEDSRMSVSNRQKNDEGAIKACLRLWLEDQSHEHIDLTDEQVAAKAGDLSLKIGVPLPTLGKLVLRDGKTGRPYDQPVTVGVMTLA